MSSHPRRRHIHLPASLGERLACAAVNGMGSLRFILIQTAFVLVWVGFNVWFLTHPFDPWPLITLNLVFSTQAAYAAPLILLAQREQARRDARRDDLEAEEVESLLKLNTRQLEILEILHELQKEVRQ